MENDAGIDELDSEFDREFSGDRAYGYQTKRLLIGNPKKHPFPVVRFLRLNRYKHYRHPALRKNGWEIIGPPRKPSWPEREGLMLNKDAEWAARCREGVTGVFWAWWWNPNQWSFTLPYNRFFCLRLEREWNRFRGEVTLFGHRFWHAPPYKQRHIPRREMLRWYVEQKREAGEPVPDKYARMFPSPTPPQPP